MRRTGVAAPHFSAGPRPQATLRETLPVCGAPFGPRIPAGAPTSEHLPSEAVHVATIPVTLLAPPGRRGTPSVRRPTSLRGRTGAARVVGHDTSDFHRLDLAGGPRGRPVRSRPGRGSPRPPTRPPHRG